MINMLYSLMVAVMSFYMFTLTYRINGVNRTLTNVPISIFENSIPIHQESDEFIPYFDQDKLYDGLTYYFNNNIIHYSKDYQLYLSYYYQDDLSICTSDKCNAVTVRIKAKIVMDYYYDKSMNFYIKDN